MAIIPALLCPHTITLNFGNLVVILTKAKQANIGI
ncbi:hypothetical protein ABNIH4_11070 [Acinetobacter baumannii ABNIH4]|nr:hypothetical protein P795_1895 [Acinetobacter baumannii ZW85-1]EGT89101.1 hypothetical protein ABNIH1_18048 [Acinetobacter baumannii ABNIH1]EGT90902.1 hypothetical protein ABNIH3_18606 [Acinetobacter baumannii ABNIH3]EGT91626.1 hypothetical protein ABNIH2_13854 [Acinetobacter baumannii ABNIH2]EGU01217.1 hypothetical protein ABNIH4_11070 [Acinetobacter baumannii ABNIH4]